MKKQVSEKDHQRNRKNMTNNKITSTWVCEDTYEFTIKAPRWRFFIWMIKGRGKLRWTVPANKKKKGFYLKGSKVKRLIYQKNIER